MNAAVNVPPFPDPHLEDRSVLDAESISPVLSPTRPPARPAIEKANRIGTRSQTGPVGQTKPTSRGAESSLRSKAFRKLHFPDATSADWNDWRWQVRTRIRTVDQLARFLELSPEESEATARHRDRLPLGITPYYMSLLAKHDPTHPLRRTVVPSIGEWIHTPGEARDPLNEDEHSPVPGLIHRYPDRVLFLISGFCSVYCRYCTRSRMIHNYTEYPFNKNIQWENALEYIGRHAQIRDVLISGGDPLDLSDERLDYLLGRLRKIPHIEFVRIGSKVPAVLPQRITPGLLRMLKRHAPLWMSLHFTHPEELTPEVQNACSRLADAGIPLGSQTVLLKGVNDSVDTMRSLVHGLLRIRVRPYYLYQCDPILGSSHFRTPVSKGLEIIQGLRGHTTGYAVPTFVIDAPGGGGKIPLLPDSMVGYEGGDLLLRNFEGRIFRYPDSSSLEPSCPNLERSNDRRFDV